MEFWHIFGSFQRGSITVGRMDINWPSLLIICNGWLTHSLAFQVSDRRNGYILNKSENATPAASSSMLALSSARYTDVRLYTLRIKIGTNQRALGELSHYWTRLRIVCHLYAKWRKPVQQMKVYLNVQRLGYAYSKSLRILSRGITWKSFKCDRDPIFLVTNLNRNLTQFRPSEIHCQPDST